MNWWQIPIIAFIIAVILTAARCLYAPEEDDHVY